MTARRLGLDPKQCAATDPETLTGRTEYRPFTGPARSVWHAADGSSPDATDRPESDRLTSSVASRLREGVWHRTELRPAIRVRIRHRGPPGTATHQPHHRISAHHI